MRIAIAILFVSACAAMGATNTAATVSRTDVQAAVTASSDGDTVKIPAGSATWTAAVTNNLKNLYFDGAGRDLTIITANTTTNINIFELRIKTNGFVHVSNLTIVGSSNEYALINISPKTAGGVDWDGATDPAYVWIHDNMFTNLSKRAISIYNNCQGLVSANWFNCPVAATGMSPDGTPEFSSNSWARAWAPLSTNCLRILTNVFDWKTTIANGAIDAYGGQVFEFAWNTVTNGNIGWHGTDSGGIIRSVLGASVHHNSCYLTPEAGNATMFNVRGGSGIWYSNDTHFAANGASAYVYISHYRSTGTNVYGGGTPCCSPFGPVTGTNYWDGNSNSFGWPALDQMGRTGPTTYGSTNISQAYMPLYAWGNTSNGTNANRFLLQNDATNNAPYNYIPRTLTYLQANRDYFEETVMPGFLTSTLTTNKQAQGSFSVKGNFRF